MSTAAGCVVLFFWENLIMLLEAQMYHSSNIVTGRMRFRIIVRVYPGNAQNFYNTCIYWVPPNLVKNVSLFGALKHSLLVCSYLFQRMLFGFGWNARWRGDERRIRSTCAQWERWVSGHNSINFSIWFFYMSVPFAIFCVVCFFCFTPDKVAKTAMKKVMRKTTKKAMQKTCFWE